ncbi:MAG: DUF3300 domain-containing protein [Thermoanaerobaculia bacterium]
MGKNLAVSLALSLMVLAPPLRAQDDTGYEPFSSDQLDNLLAPIALYPDPLLAQVLVAATFPDDVDQAARFVRGDANADDVDGQPWDVSVKSVAHYPEVLEMMADKLDWTTALGQAYVNQSTDLMASVQRLRAQARAAGNLTTTPEMEVVDSGGEIELWPAQPQYLFVPEYDPAIVFFGRAPLSFGARFLIGSWLVYDCDWRGHRVFNHGWERGPGWVQRSRPFVHINNVYVKEGQRNAIINPHVSQRRVNYQALDRYDDVHRGANFDNLHRATRGTGGSPPSPSRGAVQNKILARNINTNDPRLNEYRGHVPKAPATMHVPESPAFTPARSGFDPRAASQRGQASRAQAQPPRPQAPARPAEGRRR